MKTIYFFSNFGRLDSLPTGGGEAASRRLWQTLENAGFKVKIFNRHRYDWYNSLRFRISLCIWFVLDPIVLFFKLLPLPKKDSMFLFRSYSGTLLMFDMGITLAARLSGHKMVMCIAGGRAKPDYEAGNALYKWVFRKTIMLYDEILCEGQVTCEMVDRLTGGRVKTYYLPNFTERGFAPGKLPAKPAVCVNLVYFGRICDNKEVLLQVEIFRRLCERYDNLSFTIIGGGDSEYCAKVDAAIQASGHADRITRHPISSHDFLMEQLRNMHIFLFPSNEHCEGHSNSMNEAMAWGVVPVVSDINFLPGIVGREELVVHGYEPEPYVEKISMLIDSQLLPELSEYVHERVKNNFTQDIVENRLKEELNRL